MSIRQADVTDVDRSLIKRTLFAQVNYDLDLIQAADRLLADANQAVATAGLVVKLKLERVLPIFWDQELDCLTARDAGEEVTQLRLTFVGDEWNGYAAHVQVMDGRIPVPSRLSPEHQSRGIASVSTDAIHRTRGSTSAISSCGRQRGRYTRLPRSISPSTAGAL